MRDNLSDCVILSLVSRDSYKIMIRILHTADWHLGQTFFGYDRTGEHEVFLNWLAEEIRQKEIDALIIAGDVFDVSNPSAASQSMYYQFIYRVTVENPNLQIVIVAGNHDSAARLEAPLPLLQAMRTEVRGVVRKLEGGEIDYDHLIVELKNRKEEVELLCMAGPFFAPGGLSGRADGRQPVRGGSSRTIFAASAKAMEAKDSESVDSCHRSFAGYRIGDCRKRL